MLYKFIISLGYRSLLPSLRQLRFNYFANDNERGDGNTFLNVWMTRHCFQRMARDCRGLKDLEVYMDEKYLRWYFASSWNVPEDESYDIKYDHFAAGTIADVKGIADLRLLRGVSRPRFVWKYSGETFEEGCIPWKWPGFSNEGRALLNGIEREMKGPRESNREDQKPNGAAVGGSEAEVTGKDIKEMYELEKRAIRDELFAYVGRYWSGWDEHWLEDSDGRFIPQPTQFTNAGLSMHFKARPREID